MSAAPAPFMRYDAMEQWLKECGFSGFEIRRMVNKGLIRGRHFTSKTKFWYSAEQIGKDVLQNGKGNEG